MLAPGCTEDGLRCKKVVVKALGRGPENWLFSLQWWHSRPGPERRWRSICSSVEWGRREMARALKYAYR